MFGRFGGWSGNDEEMNETCDDVLMMFYQQTGYRNFELKTPIKAAYGPMSTII